MLNVILVIFDVDTIISMRVVVFVAEFGVQFGAENAFERDSLFVTLICILYLFCTDVYFLTHS